MRLPQLDILRALAVLLVLGRHMHMYPHADSLLFRYTHLWFKSGWVGVDLFFVLSGFLVSGLLFREYESHGSIRLGRFLVRRGLKIYPAFYALLLLTIVWQVFSRGGVDLKGVLSEALFVQNYGSSLWSHTWSLAVEEHFYLLLGITFMVLVALRKERAFTGFLPGFIAIAALLLGLRVATSLLLPYRNPTHLYPTHLRIDSLLFGVLISYYYHIKPEALQRIARARWRVLAGSVLLVLPAMWFDVSDFFMHTFGLTFLYVGFGGFLILAVSSPMPGSWLRYPLTALGYIGSHSYSIYLWHIPVLFWFLPSMQKLFGGRIYNSVELLVYIAGATVFGIFMAKLIELPVIRYRDRFFPSRSKESLASPEPESAIAEVCEVI